ncbi:DNA damage-inducible protein 1, partial [Termitomyces sp. T112]
NEPKRTMQELGVGTSAMLLLRRKVSNPAGQNIAQDAEMMRLQVLGNPQLMHQLRETQPEIAEAAVNNPQRFAELLRQTREAQQAHEREMAMLEADPFNPEAQRKIEEIIRQQGVLENMQHAIEYSPESFGIVTMLYVPVEVNGQPVKAFVDSGAQRTIMTPECAERCGIMRLVDQRFSGIAMGVGTAKILGRVHSVQLKLADLYLPCSITVMEGRDVDLLFGLDMLKAHQACIDLVKNVLRIQGREVAFLSEHELPEKARRETSGESPQAPTAIAGPSSSAAVPASESFPGSGNTSGAPPSTPSTSQLTATSQPATNRYPEASIKVLMDLGVTKEVAIRSLDAANGNVDVAASLLF